MNIKFLTLTSALLCCLPLFADDGPAPRRLVMNRDGVDGAELAALVTREIERRGLTGTAADGSQARTPALRLESRRADNSSDAIDMTWMDRESIDGIILLGGETIQRITDPKISVEKPTFAAMSGEAALIGVGYNDLGRSGKRQLALAVTPPRLERDLSLFKDLVGFRQVQVLVAKPWVSSPALQNYVADISRRLGLDIRIAPIEGREPGQLDPSIRAVYSALLPHLTREQRQKFHHQLGQAGFAVFSGYGTEDAEAGAFAAALTDPRQRLVQRLVDHIEDWLNGSVPGDLPAYVPNREEPTLNGKTAALLGLQRDERWFLKSDVLHEEALDPGRPLTLQAAIGVALDHNYDVAVAEQQVRQAKAGRRIGQSALLPQIEAGASWQQNDDNNAQVAAGFQAEEQTNVQIQARQVLFDVATLNQSRTAALEHRLSEARYDATTRNTVNQIAAAYLNVLSQKALHEINIENLKLTRANLQTARSRLNLGSAGREDVFRWEVQEAQNISAMHESRANAQTAQNDLLRLLGRDTGNWTIRDQNILRDSLFYSPEWTAHLQHGVSEQLRRHLTQLAETHSPDLAQQQLQRKMAGINYDTSLKSLFLPSLSFTATYQDLLDQTFSGGETPFGITEEGTWTFAVSAAYPIFNGGRRFHQVAQNRARIRETDYQTAATRDVVAVNVANALELIQAEWRQIAPAEQAAERATQTLAIIRRQYEQGTASWLDLQEAQEQSLSSRQQSALAHYAYLRGVFQLQNAVNDFPLLQQKSHQESWLVPATASQPEGPVNQLQGAQP